MNKSLIEQNDDLLKEIQILYENEEIDLSVIESTWDGPSDWNAYMKSFPRILFIGKEAHSSFNPSDSLKREPSRFIKNIVKFDRLTKAILNKKEVDDFEDIKSYWQQIALIEIKKINEEKKRSSESDIKKHAWIARDLLAKQINLISPHIIFCLGTIESYDIINNFSEVEKLEFEMCLGIEEYEKRKVRCWISNNKLVIDFYHASAIIADEVFATLLEKLLRNNNVQTAYKQLMSIK